MASASTTGGRASVSTTAEEANAKAAVAPPSVSTAAEEPDVRPATAPPSVSTAVQEAHGEAAAAPSSLSTAAEEAHAKSVQGEVLNEMADVAAEHGRGKGDEEAVFTKASGKLVLCVEKDDKLVQAT